MYESPVSASSARSSSVASEFQFNKSIKRLVKFMNNRVKSYVRIFRVTMFLTIIMLMIISILIFHTVTEAMEYYYELAHYVNLLGDLSYLCASTGYYARAISLIDSGVIPGDERETFFTWLREDSDEMHAIIGDVYTNKDILTEEQQHIILEGSTQVW
jgi:hypothetical protein